MFTPLPQPYTRAIRTTNVLPVAVPKIIKCIWPRMPTKPLLAGNSLPLSRPRRHGAAMSLGMMQGVPNEKQHDIVLDLLNSGLIILQTALLRP